MSTSLYESVVLVTSNQSQNAFGTGFAIYKNVHSTYLVTCAHVVGTVTETTQIKIGEYPAYLEAIGSPDGPDDVAILHVDRNLELPVLKLADVGEKGRKFVVSGFQQYSNQYLVRSLQGTLGEAIALQTRDGKKRVNAWDLKIEDEYVLQLGYSGSPIIDKSTECVVGVFSDRLNEGRKGIAVSVQVLEALWHNKPSDFSIAQGIVHLQHSTSPIDRDLPQTVALQPKRHTAPLPPKRLIDEITAHNVIPIIGAGISISVRAEGVHNPVMPGYYELLERLLKRFEDMGIISGRRIIVFQNDLAEGEPERVVRELTTRENMVFFYRELREILNPIDIVMEPSPAHTLLRTLDFSHIITTNYDRLLERFVGPMHEVITPLDQQSLAFFSESLSSRSASGKFILKLHGDITRPETISFGFERLEKLYTGQQKRSLVDFLRGVFEHKTALFLGYSFQKENEGYAELLEEYLQGFNHAHYALIPSGSIGKDWRNHLTNRTGIQFLEYHPDTLHSQVWEFITYLNTTKQDEPQTGKKWAQWYRPVQRSDYLDRQLQMRRLRALYDF